MKWQQIIHFWIHLKFLFRHKLFKVHLLTFIRTTFILWFILTKDRFLKSKSWDQQIELVFSSNEIDRSQVTLPSMLLFFSFSLWLVELHLLSIFESLKITLCWLRQLCKFESKNKSSPTWLWILFLTYVCDIILESELNKKVFTLERSLKRFFCVTRSIYCRFRQILLALLILFFCFGFLFLGNDSLSTDIIEKERT
jgi:hypothetical protein